MKEVLTTLASLGDSPIDASVIVVAPNSELHKMAMQSGRTCLVDEESGAITICLDE